MSIKEGKWQVTKEFEQQYQQATKRGALAIERGAYAVGARYDKATRRLVVDLANGATLLVPTRLIQGLQQATAAQLADVEILGAGTGLYWPKLDVDTAVTGLLKGVFGTRAWMAELGRAAGRVTSKAKPAGS